MAFEGIDHAWSLIVLLSLVVVRANGGGLCRLALTSSTAKSVGLGRFELANLGRCQPKLNVVLVMATVG